MSSPWLSVVVPTHNGERWLAQTLQSLSDQNDKDFECVVVDSSSTAECMAIIERFSKQLPIVVQRRPDLTAWTAKTNFAVSLASGTHICMLHQDDLWRPGRSEWLRDWLRSSPGGTLYLHSSLIVDASSRPLGTWRCPLPADGRPVARALLLQRLLVQNFIAIPAPTFRREAFIQVGGMDVSLWYTADWDLYLKLATHGEVYYRNEPMTCFRVHSGSLTMTGSRSPNDFRAQMQTVIDRYAACLPANSYKSTMKQASASLEVNLALACAQNGHPYRLLSVCLRILSLGPMGIVRYLRDSRLLERVLPRLRARLAGDL
jgi:GT2 family glycosyltransferase